MIYKYNAKKDSLFLKESYIDSSIASIGTFQIKAFMQHKLRVTEKLSFNLGLHFIQLNSTKFMSVEPRFGMDYLYGKGHKLSAGAGLHSRLEPLAYYANESKYLIFPDARFGIAEEVYGAPNKNLQATRSIHFVLANTLKLAPQLILKAELYCQYLFQIPVKDGPDYVEQYASINYQYPSIYTYSFVYQDKYKNAGKGLNYGIDLSIEKAFAKNYYLLINGSYYQSKYNTPYTELVYHHKWLNTRYNGNFIFTFTAGKDFVIGKQKNNRFSMNCRTIWAGNNRSEYFDYFLTNEEPFQNRLSNYFRLDTRVAYIRNKKKYSWTLSLDIQNTTNRENETSNPLINSTLIIPFLNYKVNF